MKLEQLTHSKCPNCKKHGISAFFKWGKTSSSTLRCKYCDKQYKVPEIIRLFIIFGSAFFAFVICKSLSAFVTVPNWAYYVLGLLLYFIGEYFAPLEEKK